MISEHPSEVNERVVSGHCEGNLSIGACGASAVGTLVEHSTRFVLSIHLPNDQGAVAVEEAIRKEFATLPKKTGLSNHPADDQLQI